MVKDRVKSYQVLLKQLGFYTGEVDGVNGPLTVTAIKRFQTIHGAIPTGIFIPAQVRQLQGSILPSRTDTPYNPFPHDDTKALTAYYGQPGSINLHTHIPLPYPLKLAWDTSVTVNTITIHEKCADAFLHFFEDILHEYKGRIEEYRLNLYGGSYNNRPIRGGTRASTHAFAAAIDLAPAENQLRWTKQKALFAKAQYAPLMEIAEKNALTNLGQVEGFDYMHFQAAWR